MVQDQQGIKVNVFQMMFQGVRIIYESNDQGFGSGSGQKGKEMNE